MIDSGLYNAPVKLYAGHSARRNRLQIFSEKQDPANTSGRRGDSRNGDACALQTVRNSMNLLKFRKINLQPKLLLTIYNLLLLRLPKSIYGAKIIT